MFSSLTLIQKRHKLQIAILPTFIKHLFIVTAMSQSQNI